MYIESLSGPNILGLFNIFEIKQINKSEEYIVVGSKGNSYSITKAKNGSYSCNCNGFKFRKSCSHIKGVLSGNRKLYKSIGHLVFRNKDGECNEFFKNKDK